MSSKLLNTLIVKRIVELQRDRGISCLLQDILWTDWERRLYYLRPLSSNLCRERRMTQKLRSETGRVVICLFCGTRTFVPSSPARDIAHLPDSGPGITIVRCHMCRKEAPYSASEILHQEVPLSEGNSRSRAAGL